MIAASRRARAPVWAALHETQARRLASGLAGPRVFVNGRPAGTDASISVHDEALLRGTGVFEVVGVAGSRMVGLDEHVLRLLASIEATAIDKAPLVAAARDWEGEGGAGFVPAWVEEALAADERLLFAWLRWQVRRAAAAQEPSATGGAASPAAESSSIRLIVTRGTPLASDGDGVSPRVVVIRTDFRGDVDLRRMPELSLLVLPAPWHLAGRSSRPEWDDASWDDDGSASPAPRRSGALKWLSYGNNMRSMALAAREGASDALLVGSGPGGGRVVLEGPTFAAAFRLPRRGGGHGWVTPCPVRNDLLPSVTTATAQAACEGRGIDFGTVAGVAADEHTSPTVPRAQAWRTGRWAYGDAATAAAAAGGRGGSLLLSEALAHASGCVAMSAAKHVSPVTSLLIPARVLELAEAAADGAEAEAWRAVRGRCADEGRVLRMPLPRASDDVAEAYADAVEREGVRTDDVADMEGAAGVSGRA